MSKDYEEYMEQQEEDYKECDYCGSEVYELNDFHGDDICGDCYQNETSYGE